jgi:hypothetical protein
MGSALNWLLPQLRWLDCSVRRMGLIREENTISYTVGIRQCEEVLTSLCFFRRVHAGLLLGLGNVFLVADPLVAEPIAHLTDSNRALSGQFLLDLLARVRIAQMRVKIFIQYFGCLFAEVPSLTSEIYWFL